MNPRSILLILIVLPIFGWGQNPLITDQYTADPTARVFDGKVFVFPSHDILATEGKGRPGWFCMEDYHVFSSKDLTTWADHGMIVSQESVPWVDSDSYSMWAPDCIEKDGKYYFYFPSRAADTTYNGRGFTIGVAIADNPEGPYKPQPTPITGVKGIDPNVLIDKDGQAYLYWSQGHIYGARLKDNMLELAEKPRILQKLPDEGLKEGPFVFEKNGIYYMTYPHVENKTERLEYATGDNPLGPFEVKGVIMDEWENGCWTNHHSIINYQGQWLLFYHHNDLSPDFDKNRSICADSLFFGPDGAIQKVTPTLRGVGITPSTARIQLDGYSNISERANIDFLDSANTFRGWKTTFPDKGNWVRYNSVEFTGQEKKLNVNIKTSAKTKLRIVDGKSNDEIATLNIARTTGWTVITQDLDSVVKGTVDLVVESLEGQAIEIDWISFE